MPLFIGKLLIVLIIIGGMFMMLLIRMLRLPLVLLLFMVEVGLGEIMLCIMCHACNTSFVLSCKNAKVVARKLGSKYKEDKTCIWVLKTIVTNLVGPNKSWVPKTQA
jgi:hypothetical protein